MSVLLCSFLLLHASLLQILLYLTTIITTCMTIQVVILPLYIFTCNSLSLSIQSTPPLFQSNRLRQIADSIRQFLEKGTALDPRFKTEVADEAWARLEEELMNRAHSRCFLGYW